MKKKIISIVFVAAIAVAAAWNVSQKEDKATLSDIALGNVEALANQPLPKGTLYGNDAGNRFVVAREAMIVVPLDAEDAK